MTKDEINNLNEEAKRQLAKKLAEKWSMEDHIELFPNEVRMPAEAEAEERELKWVRELIENPKYIEQAEKVSRDVLAKQAEILERGGNPADPAEYDDDDNYDDDDYDADEWYLDDECYPDDE